MTARFGQTAAARMPSSLWLTLATLLLLAACAETRPVERAPSASPPPPGYKVGKPYRINGVDYEPRVDPTYDQVGVASWYGRKFHSRRTANGERFDMHAMTAAHTTLPMPTMVRVTNLENGRSVDLRINDRGPFAHGRIIDVSRRAAEVLGFRHAGVARVRVQVLADQPLETAAAAPSPAAPVPTAPAARTEPTVRRGGTGAVYVQAGAFARYHNALEVSGRLRDLGPVQVSPVVIEQGEVFRVRLGPVSSVDEAERLRMAASDAGFPASRVIVD